MTAAAELLDRLESLGVTARADGEMLRLRPAKAIPPELLPELRAHKPELLALLAPPSVVVDLAAARQRLTAAGCLTRKGQGRVLTSRGPGRLLSFVAQLPDHCTVLLDVDQRRAVELPVGDCVPEVSP